MHKLWATLQKDFKILWRDKVGLTLMFVMPIALVLVITSIQDSTFRMVNDNKITVLFCDRDQSEISHRLKESMKKLGMFDLRTVNDAQEDKPIHQLMKSEDALVSLTIPINYSVSVKNIAKSTAKNALKGMGMEADFAKDSINDVAISVAPILILHYHPVLQESYRSSVQGAIYSAVKGLESQLLLSELYSALGQKAPVEDISNPSKGSTLKLIPALIDGSRTTPNATEHNIPAWTIFAMFFIVISLGSSMVREKQNGSFIRLKTLPSNFLLAIYSKQLIYLSVAMVQVIVIFSIGIWLFPYLSLPALRLPSDLTGLVIVSLASGTCAISYAMAIGIMAETVEQANGFGAVSVVILAAVGGILIPSFAMPDSFGWALKISPLHWALECYYNLFLEKGTLKQVFHNLVPLVICITVLQAISLLALKRKKLI